MSKKKEEFEFDPYSLDKVSKIPGWIKITILKYWAAGASCYLVFLGLNLYFADYLDRAATFCMVFGLLNEWIVNRIIRMMGNPKYDTERFCFITGSSVVSLILNLFYAAAVFILMFGVCYNISESTPLKIYFEEPFIFAAIYVTFDAILLVIKFYVLKLINKIGNSRKQKEL